MVIETAWGSKTKNMSPSPEIRWLSFVNRNDAIEPEIYFNGGECQNFFQDNIKFSGEFLILVDLYDTF